MQQLHFYFMLKRENFDTVIGQSLDSRLTSGSILLSELFPELSGPTKRDKSTVRLEVGSAGRPGFLETRTELAENEYWVTADVDPHWAGAGKAYEQAIPRFKAIEADGRQLPFVGEQFDEVVFTRVMSDVLSVNDIKAMIDEGLRVILPKGRIVINEPYDPRTKRGTFLVFNTAVDFIKYIQEFFPQVDINELAYTDEKWNAPTYGKGVDDLEAVVYHQIVITKKQDAEDPASSKKQN